MHPVAQFEFIILLLVAVIGLQLAARKLRLPPAAALVAGGIALAFVPGIPAVVLDPDLVLVLFLPPLLMDGAFLTVLSDFRRHIAGILSLAIGAVAFTTLTVGVAAHWAVPGLPWAACFALGAVVSPPDAVAAKAVLDSVRLPRRVWVLLEGESLLNDAAGLVLFRFAVAAALTGTFDAGRAVGTFAVLAVGGVAVGAAFGFAWVKLLRRLGDTSLMIAGSLLLPWSSYMAGEALGVSGVIATVTAGLIFGWYQHEIFTAEMRLKGTAFYQVLVFLLEAFVFVLIGLSLRGVVDRFGGFGPALGALGGPILAVVAAVTLARFAWIFANDAAVSAMSRFRRVRIPFSAASCGVMGWAGMRGVVTLAIALSLPDEMPGRDFILASAFAVILVTVLVQGTSMGWVIRRLKLDAAEERPSGHLTQAQAMARMTAAQLKAVEALAREPDGTLRHPRLLEQYTYRADVIARYADRQEEAASERREHFEVMLAAAGAGRAELLKLHRAGRIHDEVLRAIESSLDLQEVMARAARG
ncbi:Na+/H+ antiporter [Lichenibacterium dinghuense]|uniref:Na+/H+ antiporter n=1 Tax=Lichenibacterium dinghuense TaxID=2895977 RepID=UPI001F0070D9|nr:Na+/H+ antiporter [Lichenibacterium sp. 6Y81]